MCCDQMPLRPFGLELPPVCFSLLGTLQSDGQAGVPPPRSSKRSEKSQDGVSGSNPGFTVSPSMR